MLSPRENLNIFGHPEAQEAFLTSFHSSRFPYAWIIAGPVGSGKATFAFHMTRYILSGRQDRNVIFVENDPLHRRIMAKSHGDLWTLGGEDDHEIGVDSIRELNRFLNQTSAEGGWRVVIIDGADWLNRNAANALLKRLEEPPPQTVFFLTTAVPGRLLPTVRSRCQLLTLKPLREQEIREVLLSQGFSPPDFISIAEGSPGRLMRLLEGEGAKIHMDLQKILGKQETAVPFIHAYGGDEESYGLIEDLLRNYLHTHLLAKVGGEDSHFAGDSLDQTLKIYEKIEALFDQCRFAQLDKKATLTCVFACLENRI